MVEIPSRIQCGIIVSKFDEIIGPTSYLSFPEHLHPTTIEVISRVSVDLFDYSDNLSRKLSIITFPSINLQGLVKHFEWEDEARRSGKDMMTVTILLEDETLYKYQDDFEESVDNFAKNLINQIFQKATQEEQVISSKAFHTKILAVLSKITKNEHPNSNSSDEFPPLQSKVELPTYVFKTIIIGDPNVGKTSTVLQFAEKTFRLSYIPTIGANITEKSIVIGQTMFQLMMWDVAGQSKFKAIRNQYYSGAVACVIMFDLTNPESFSNVKKWYQDLVNFFKDIKQIGLILCGNKADLADQIQVSTKTALGLANELDVPYFQTSAKSGENVEKSFKILVKNLIKSKKIGLRDKKFLGKPIQIGK